MIQQIEAIICNGENLTPEDIHVPDRETRIKEARQIIMYFCKEETRMTQKQIGAYFGKDHSTAYNGWKRTNDMYETDPVFRAKIDNYKLKIIPMLSDYYARQRATMTLEALMSNIIQTENRLSEAIHSFENLKADIEKLK